MKNVYLLIFLSSAFLTTVQAQTKSKDELKRERTARINQLRKEEDENALIYNKQNAFGIKLNTDGYGVFYEHGKYKSLQLTNLWWLQLDERKDPKEDRITNTTPDGIFQIGNPFVYGKINNFYQFKIGLGQQRLIGGKDVKNGVAVTAIYGGGITAGLLKPYYLNVNDSVSSSHDVKYSPENEDVFLYGPINGGSGFGKGWGEVKFVPGVHARAALRFDYGHYNELLSAIETGVTAQYYSKNIDMIVNQPGKKFFFNAYVALVFGKRK